MAGGWSISTTSGSAARPSPGRSPRPTTGSGSPARMGRRWRPPRRACSPPTELSRERQKGGSTVRYDLRPLAGRRRRRGPGPPVVLRARTRFDPVLGTGGRRRSSPRSATRRRPARVASIVRERLILAEEQDPARPDHRGSRCAGDHASATARLRASARRPLAGRSRPMITRPRCDRRSPSSRNPAIIDRLEMRQVPSPDSDAEASAFPHCRTHAQTRRLAHPDVGRRSADRALD